MSNSLLRIATRESPLALWQANHIRDQLRIHWPHLQIELLPMRTSGDQFLKDKLQSLGGKGLFVKELEEALLEQRADLAVHSMKDVPAEFPDGLGLAAICVRDNPLDAFVSNQYATLDGLPLGATVGTASLRRQFQLLALRPDLQIKTLRGNIHTRLQKLQTEGFDAIILAAAGLERMGLQQHIREILSDDRMLPACGQGALGIECRLDDDKIIALMQPLNHALTATCVFAERRVNAQLGGNCHVPLAVYCKPLDDNQLVLRAKVADLQGQTVLHSKEISSIKNTNASADAIAANLLAAGAERLLRLETP